MAQPTRKPSHAASQRDRDKHELARLQALVDANTKRLTKILDSIPVQTDDEATFSDFFRSLIDLVRLYGETLVSQTEIANLVLIMLGESTPAEARVKYDAMRRVVLPSKVDDTLKRVLKTYGRKYEP